MRLLGVVITTRRAIMRERTANAAHDAQHQLRTLLADGSHPLRRTIVKVARSAAKDCVEEMREQRREEFEADPAFQQWARQQREHDLAEAEKAQPAAPPADTEDSGGESLGDSLERDAVLLRYSILGLLVEHGVQVTASIGDVFEQFAPDKVMSGLSGLVSDGLVEVKRGVYSATLAGVGLGSQKEKEERYEDPDPQ